MEVNKRDCRDDGGGRFIALYVIAIVIALALVVTSGNSDHFNPTGWCRF